MTDATGHDILDVDVGPDDPATDVPVETLRSGLESETTGVRLHAANVASFVPREEVDTLKAVVPELLDCLSDDKRVVVYQSAIALSLVAENDPAALEAGVPRLVDLLDFDHSLTQAMVAQCLGHVAREKPEYFLDQVETLVDAALARPAQAVDPEELENPDLDQEGRRTLAHINHEETSRQQYAREITVNLLVELADYDATAVIPHVERLLPLLEDDNVAIRTATADVVANVAQEDPEAVADAVEPLCENLDHPNDSLVATTITALGFVGDRTAADPLRDLAEDEERNEDLRDLARETAGFVEGTRQ